MAIPGRPSISSLIIASVLTSVPTTLFWMWVIEDIAYRLPAVLLTSVFLGWFILAPVAKWIDRKRGLTAF